MEKLFYKYRAIGNLDTLAKMLRLTTPQLRRLAENADRLYRPGPRFQKSDGTFRETWNAMPQLKGAQGCIKRLILARVDYPNYLQGGLMGRDYKQNAGIHKRSRIVINEDIESFFPSISTDAVFDIWRHFFHFPDPVAQCLTKMTTKNGQVPQGARTSTHLANLVLWRSEDKLNDQYRQRGIRYSRFVDDISVSAQHNIPAQEKTNIVGAIVGMLAKHSLIAKRSKHAIMTRGQSMRVNKLVVNRSAGLTKKDRLRIRAAVHEVEQLAQNGADSHELHSSYLRVAGRVAMLKRFHPARGQKLQLRLDQTTSKLA